MRAGEVWFLDATMVHAAYSPPGPSRIALCLDFDVPRELITTCLRQPIDFVRPPMLITRPLLQQKQIESLVELGTILDLKTVREIIRLFGIVHFHRQVNAAACFDWLIAAAERSSDALLVQRSREYKAYCLHRRIYGEHFAW
jgi:hypothetical protein